MQGADGGLATTRQEEDADLVEESTELLLNWYCSDKFTYFLGAQ